MTKPCDSAVTGAEPCDILSLLEREALISPTGRQLVETFMRTWDVAALDALLMTRSIPESDLADALAGALRIERVHQVSLAGKLAWAPESQDVLPFKRARAWQCLLLRAEGETGRLMLVAADPTQVDRISEIKQGLKQELTLSVGELSDIVRGIDELYPLSAQLPSIYGSADPRREDPA